MPSKSRKSALKLTTEELQTLEIVSKSRTESKTRTERADVLLRYINGEIIADIARFYKTHRTKIESQINKALQIGAVRSLDDLPRPGRPGTITDDARAWIVSLACIKPNDLGYPQEFWTTSMLAAYARENCEGEGHPCLAKLSKGTVSKMLSSHDLKPHKTRYYLERRDPLHDEKMSEVLLVYKEVATQLSGEGEALDAYIAYDEKPGIQAVENTAPDLMPVPGMYANVARDYEYKRHGTLSLLAGIDLMTGGIVATVEERHRSVEFIEFLKILDLEYADKQKIKVILDNHSAHTSKKTMEFLATKPNRFEFIFTPKHASWLNLIESFFSKLARTLLRGIRVKTKEELRERILFHIDLLNQSPVLFRWKYKMEEES